MDFDPDVFADALVFCRRPCRACRAPCSHIAPSAIVVVAPHRFLMPADFNACERHACGDGYRFAKRKGKSAIQE